MPLRGEVGNDISRIGRNRDRRLEESLLPSARRFAAEGDGAKQCSSAGPEMTHVSPAVRGASFVKPDAGNDAVSVGAEFHSEFQARPIAFEGIAWRRSTSPYTARTRRCRRRSRGCESPCCVGGQSVARQILYPWVCTTTPDSRGICDSSRQGRGWIQRGRK